MNLRILKKLSKKALPLLETLWAEKRYRLARPSVFPAVRGECLTNIGRIDLKHHEHRVTYNTCTWPGQRVYPSPLPGKHRVLDSQYLCPLKGTPMTGGMVGYEEPEWEEETAWELLRNILFVEFRNWDELGPNPPPRTVPRLSRDLSTPRQVFTAANDLIARLNQEADHA